MGLLLVGCAFEHEVPVGTEHVSDGLGGVVHLVADDLDVILIVRVDLSLANMKCPREKHALLEIVLFGGTVEIECAGMRIRSRHIVVVDMVHVPEMRARHLGAAVTPRERTLVPTVQERRQEVLVEKTSIGHLVRVDDGCGHCLAS
jgi:hypothetical protein